MISARCKESKLKKTSDRQRTLNVRERFLTTVQSYAVPRDKYGNMKQSTYSVNRHQCAQCGMLTTESHVC